MLRRTNIKPKVRSASVLPSQIGEPTEVKPDASVQPPAEILVKPGEEEKVDLSTHEIISVNGKADQVEMKCSELNYMEEFKYRHFIKRRCLKKYVEETKAMNNRKQKRQEFLKRLHDVTVDEDIPSKLLVRDFFYYNPKNNPMAKTVATDSPAVDVTPSEPVPSEENVTAAPQLRVTEDGTVKIDESSLFVKHQTKYSDNVISEFGKTRFDSLNCRSYRRYHFTPRWSKKETIRFYKALQVFGTDFDLIAKYFPKRTRKEIKAKFTSEDKKNTAYMDKLLTETVPFDIAFFMPDSDEEIDEKEKVKAARKTLKGKRKYASGFSSTCPGSEDESLLTMSEDSKSVEIVLDLDNDMIHMTNSSPTLEQIVQQSERASRCISDPNRRAEDDDVVLLSSFDSERLPSLQRGQSFVFDNLSRLFEASRNGASPLIFVSSRSNRESSPASTGEIEIHMLTEDLDQSNFGTCINFDSPAITSASSTQNVTALPPEDPNTIESSVTASTFMAISELLEKPSSSSIVKDDNGINYPQAETAESSLKPGPIDSKIASAELHKVEAPEPHKVVEDVAVTDPFVHTMESSETATKSEKYESACLSDVKEQIVPDTDKATTAEVQTPQSQSSEQHGRRRKFKPKPTLPRN